MAIKIKHISTRFLLQSIFTILIIATLIFVMFYSGFRKKDTLTAQALTSDIRTSLILSGLTIETALDQQKADLNFVETGCDLLIRDQNKRVDFINQELEELKNLKFLQPYFENSEVPDSLSNSLRAYNLILSKTLYSLKEKGNSNGGAVKELADLIHEVYSELEYAPDNGMQATQFNGYALAYLSDYSYVKLNQLLSFCNEILIPFYDFEDYDTYTLEEKINRLTDKLKHIKTIDLRLRDTELLTGQFYDLENAEEALNAKFNRFDEGIQEQISRYNMWWIWVFLALALILTTAYVVVMGRFSKTVVSSVRKLHKLTIGLSHGSISDNVPEEGKYEFDEFNKDLKQLYVLLNNRKDFINSLLKDKFDATLEIKNDEDLIGHALLKLKDKMHATKQEQLKYNKENTDRRYINEGLAKFGDILRVNSHNTTLLAEALIKELTRYMGALQGVLFYSGENEDDTTLHLAAAFAYERKRFLEKTIKKGEGLIGTCAIEKKSIQIDEIPDGYVTLKSGLGDTPPNHLLLLPVVNEDQLVGVIEIASLKAFSQIDIELAENIASNLASTLINTRINSKTSELLTKSQEQAAEMAEQEEEMRQNMEELKATQEESARREEEMQGLLDAIGKSFYVFEYDLTGNIVHVNDRMLEFLKQPIDQILHQSHQKVLSEDSILTTDYIAELVFNNKPANAEEIMNWGTKKYKYMYSLTPVENGMGQVVKVLNLFNIEEVSSES